MKPLPDNILRRMSKEDRNPMGKAGVTMAEGDAKQTLKSEKELQQQCVAILRQRGIICNVSRMDRKKSDMVGWPDLTFSLKRTVGIPGHTVYPLHKVPLPCAFECKINKEQPTEEQAKVMAQLMENGWEVRVVRSLQEFIDIIGTITA